MYTVNSTNLKLWGKTKGKIIKEEGRPAVTKDVVGRKLATERDKKERCGLMEMSHVFIVMVVT